MRERPVVPRDPSRRDVLKAGVAGAVAAGVTSPGAFAGKPFPEVYGPYLYLLDRATFGLESGMLDQINRRGYEGFLEWQLDAANINDSAAESALSSILPTLGMTPWEILTNYADSLELPVIYAQMTLPLRGYLSKRQLLYRMCDFWSNYFNTHVESGRQGWLYTPYHENAICAHALGNFRDLLHASAEGASMLWFLNQDESDAAAPIENYARELLELHTLGLSDNPATPTYTEQDMLEAARIFTGWGFKSVADNSYGDFEFRPSRHDNGTKTVLGVTYPSVGGPGKPEGDDLIDFLVDQPSTAFHIADRLIAWFIMDDPPQWFRNKVGLAFFNSNGDIKTTLRVLFDPKVIDRIGRKRRRKLRRPLNLVTAYLRAAKPVYKDPDLLPLLEQMGQVPGNRTTPDGYPANNGQWISNMHARLTFIDSGVHQRAGFNLNDGHLDSLFPPVAGKPLAQQANEIVAGGALSAGEVARIQQFADGSPVNVDPRRDVLALTLSAPTFQYLLG